MYIVRRYQPQIERLISSRSSGAFSLAFGFAVVALGLLAGAILKFSPPPMNGRPWDSLILVDGAWRITCGQVPHRDFYNHTGDLPYYMTALGMKLGHPGVASIDYGNVIFMAAVVLLAMAILRRRTTAAAACLYTIFLGLLVITPKPLGDPYDYTDHAMLYNRFGEAVLGVFGALVFLQPKAAKNHSWLHWLEAVAGGLLLTGLLGSKLNYFAVGLGFLIVACVAGRVRVRWAVACLGATALLCILFAAMAHFSFSEITGDYRTMAAGENLGRRFASVIVQGVKSFALFPILLIPVWENSLGGTDAVKHQSSPWPHLLVTTAIFGAGVLLMASNCQIGEMPLLGLGALYGLELILRQSDSIDSSALFTTGRHLGGMALVLLFLLPSTVDDFKTIRFATAAAIKKDWVTIDGWENSRLADFRLLADGTRQEEMRRYAEDLKETTQMLRRHLDSSSRLNVMVFSNPFQAVFGWQPATRGLLNVSSDTVTQKSHPQIDTLLGHADYLLTDRNSTALKEAYGTEWDKLNLEVVDQTTAHSLYRIQRK